MNYQKIFSKGFLIKMTLLVMFIIFMSCFVISTTDATRFRFRPITEFNQGWNLNGTTITLPYKVAGKKNTTICLENKIPETISDNMLFFITSNFCVNQIYIDDELRYSYGEHRQLPFGNVIGNIVCVTHFYASDAGKTIRLELTPEYTRTLEIPQALYGYESDFMTYVIKRNAWKIIVCSIFMSFIAVSLLMCFRQKHIRGRIDKSGILKSYALFTFTGIVWLLSSSEIPQIFTNASETVSFISYVSLSFLAVPYAYFCKEVFNQGKKWFTWLYRLGCFNTLCTIILYMASILDPPETLIVSHLYLVIMLGFNIYCIHKEKSTNPLIHLLRHAIIFLGIFVTLGLLVYYKMPTSGLDAIAFGIGFTLFSASLFSITIRESENMLQDIVRLDIYKELAYKDTMTNLGNRTAFDNALLLLTKNNNETDQVTLIIFDLNDLKKANDGIGHHAGDEMIIGIARCISDTFQSIGHSFRIGGDEFATLLVGEHIAIENYFENLSKQIENYNQTHEFKLSVSYGYAIEKIKNITEETVKDFFNEADSHMYEYKKNYKLKSTKNLTDTKNYLQG